MLQRASRKLGQSALILFAALFAQNASSAPVHHTLAEGQPESEVRRLLEYPDGKRRWAGMSEMARLSHIAHESGRCGGFIDVTDHPDLRPVFLESLHGLSSTGKLPKPAHQNAIHEMYKRISPLALEGAITVLSSFHNRYYTSETGVAAAHWIAEQFQKFSFFRSDTSVQLFSHKFPQPSVIARIEGNGPLAHETVIIGAHEDSILAPYGFPSPNGRAPGADDDASGTATVLETFRILSESGFRPNRSIEFMTYAGEELGLLGSQDIAAHYQKQGRIVAGVLQLDMTMHPTQARDITLISDHVNQPLTNFLKVLIDEYVQVPWRESKCGYGCSDHASWTKAGYPSAFPAEGDINTMNKRLHTENDRLEYLDAEFGTHYLKLAIAFAVELSTPAPRWWIH